jgi:hypothetical protein
MPVLSSSHAQAYNQLFITREGIPARPGRKGLYLFGAA